MPMRDSNNDEIAIVLNDASFGKSDGRDAVMYDEYVHQFIDKGLSKSFQYVLKGDDWNHQAISKFPLVLTTGNDRMPMLSFQG